MAKEGQTERPYNPPPTIIVHGVTDIRPVQDLLQETLGDQYSMKLVRKDQVEIQIMDKGKFAKLIEALKSKKKIFEIRKKNKKDTFKVNLRNMHPSIETDLIVKELELYGHKVVNIYNVKNSTTQEPLPFFHIDLELRENNEDIYSIKMLLNMLVTFEPRNQNPPRQHNKSQSSGSKNKPNTNRAHRATANDAPDVDVVSDTIEPDTEETAESGPSHSATETSPQNRNNDTPVAYVQPMRSHPPKTRRQNHSNYSSPNSSQTTFSNFTPQEQVATLNRLSDLEGLVMSTLSAMDSAQALTNILRRRLR